MLALHRAFPGYAVASPATLDDVLTCHAREYLDWEVALIDQVKRDPTIRFRTY